MRGRIIPLVTRYSLLVTLLAGCAYHRQAALSPTTRFASTRPLTPPDPWVITSHSPDLSYRAPYLGNGYLGQVMDLFGLGTRGSGVGQEGPAAGPGAGSRPARGPQPASMAGLYDHEHLFTLPPLFPLVLEMNGRPYGSDPSSLSDYSQSLDMRRGLLITRATWEGQPLEITAFVSRADPTLAVCRLVAPPGLRPRVEAGRALPSVHWGSRLISSGGGPSARAITSVLETRVSQGLNGPDPDVAFGSLAGRSGTGEYEQLLSRHAAAWQKLWTSDIVIEGNPADQQLVHALLYQLLASVREGVKPAPGFPPMGLSNPAAFGGHVFWDADTWIFPALLPLHPELARTILDYRFRTLPGARANAAAEGKRGASYAWESAATGREVATLQTRHGRHVTADVARAFWQYYLDTGDHAWLRQYAWPVLSATADYWVSRAQLGPQEEIRQVSTPDENAGLVDNSAWTNFGARENLRDAAAAARLLGLPVGSRWTEVAEGLLIPRDSSGMILEYSGYKGQPAKQADTLLLLFPGDMPLPQAEQERMYRSYVNRTIHTGPAMTESVHSVIAARLGHAGEAYTRFRQSVDPFVRPPFDDFSEKRTRDNLQFLTGAAGSLQAILYGFAGLRLEDSPTPVFKPQLPAAWSGLILRGVAWRGRRYDVVIRRGQPVRVIAE